MGHSATRQLLHLWQEHQSVSDYSIDFHTLVTTAGWNKKGLYGDFLQGFSEWMKDELTICDLP